MKKQYKTPKSYHVEICQSEIIATSTVSFSAFKMDDDVTFSSKSRGSFREDDQDYGSYAHTSYTDL